jgi:hypothetical protein
MSRSNLIPATIVTIWLIGCAAIFWWFEYRYWGAYEKQLIQFDKQAIHKLYPILKRDSENRPLVVHFKDDDCPCERYRLDHINTIKATLNKTNQVTLSDQDHRLAQVYIPASPAVAIWDKNGVLAYFGPYSSGMACGEGFDFIKSVLEKLSKNENPHWVNNQGFGCFCQWKEA